MKINPQCLFSLIIFFCNALFMSITQMSPDMERSISIYETDISTIHNKPVHNKLSK